MKRRLVPFVLLLALAILAAEGWARLRAPRPPREGAGAPDFSLPAASGRTVSLEALRGRVVAVNFWATWCPPCKEEIPDFAAVYAAATAQGKCLEVLGVAEDSGSREEIVKSAKELGINYPVLFDDDGKAGEAYRIQAYPRTFLVDARGKLRRTFEGAVSRRELEQALTPLLAEAPGSCPKVSL
jgi:cytochrome c biogenesis protein CcmG, thiol:disulfide interchange protein DsbE